MIILWTLYVYDVSCVGVGSINVQLKASILLHQFILVVASGETKHRINYLIILKIIYRDSEILNIQQSKINKTLQID